MIKSTPCYISQRRTSRRQVDIDSSTPTPSKHSKRQTCEHSSARLLYTGDQTILSRLITWTTTSRIGSAKGCHMEFAEMKPAGRFLVSVIEQPRTLFGLRWPFTSTRRSLAAKLCQNTRQDLELEGASFVGSTFHLPDACRAEELRRS